MRRITFLQTLAVLTLALAAAAPAEAGPFQDYIERAETTAAWKEISSVEKDGVIEARLSLTSQVWQGHTWTHNLWIYRPLKPRNPDISTLIVTGGAGRAKREGARLSRAFGSTVVVLDRIPNQPLYSFREDELIAHSFQRFLETGDPTWPLLLPMTKATVKAFDAVGEWSKGRFKTPIKRFMVTGGSKRGWTTWLSAVADERVIGIVPIVYDNLNLQAQMNHQLKSWGDFSIQIHAYTRRGLQGWISTDKGKTLRALVDPWEHREGRIKDLPKIIVQGTNDPYWCLDAIDCYYDDLGKNTHILYCPNQGHGIRDAKRLVATSGVFVERLAAGKPMPALSVSFTEQPGGRLLTVNTGEPATELRLWTARSNIRDFRRARWVKRTLGPADGDYKVRMITPQSGWQAGFVEAVYGEGDSAFALTTRVTILNAPDAKLPMPKERPAVEIKPNVEKPGAKKPEAKKPEARKPEPKSEPAEPKKKRRAFHLG